MISMRRSWLALGLAAGPLAGCVQWEVPTVASVNGIPLTNYRCAGGSLVQVAYDEERALVRIGERNYPVFYVPSDVGVIYLGDELALTIDDKDIFVGSRTDADGDGRVPGRRCTYESGG